MKVVHEPSYRDATTLLKMHTCSRPWQWKLSRERKRERKRERERERERESR